MRRSITESVQNQGSRVVDCVLWDQVFCFCSGKFKTGTTREVLEKRCTIEHCDKGHQHPSRWSHWIYPDPKDDNAILWKQKLTLDQITAGMVKCGGSTMD